MRVGQIYVRVSYNEVAYVLSDHGGGQESDAFTESGGEDDAELFAFKLDPGNGTVSVTQLVFKITDIVGLTDSDWSNVEIVVDDDNNGNIDPTDTTLVGGLGAVDQGAGTVTFSTSFVSAVTNYILRADFVSL